MTIAIKTKRRSPRGNWLVVKMRDGKISWCTWVRTWAGVQASKRTKEEYLAASQAVENVRAQRQKRTPVNIGRVFVLDIERMLDFAVTEGANEINDLHKLWEKEAESR